jgi:probable F420-dependent oxidoreductase
VKVYAGMDPRLPLQAVADHARRVEALGYDGLHVPETIHDSLAVSLLALEHTQRLVVRTAVTLAFPRSPTLTAYEAWDLAKFSGGRFHLGLGTQIRQNIAGRYGVPWSDPVAWMRDYLGALDALYDAFGSGGALDFAGDRYRLSRMQPYFNPGPDGGVARPPTYLGGVNARLCALAGELADGLVTHPTNSDPRYLEEVCLPNLRAGAGRGGRSLDGFELVVGAQFATGPTNAAVAEERERQRRLFAFLLSTPAYQLTLDLYGWSGLGPQLRALVREDRWDGLPALLTDDVLDTLVVSAGYEDLPGVIARRYGDLCQGVTLSLPPGREHDDALGRVVEALHAST